MKMMNKLKALKNGTGRPVANVEQQNGRPVERPVVKLKKPIWKGLRIHSGSWQSFRELLRLRATAPFKFTLPGLRAGKAAWRP